jgi:tetratricopeptide (TPR) repeat protein
VTFNKKDSMDAARRLAENNQLDKALKEYMRIVHEDPGDVRVRLKIGELHEKQGDTQAAIEAYREAARYYEEQRFDLKAVGVHKKILELDPRQAGTAVKLAELHRGLGLMTEAQHYESMAAQLERGLDPSAAVDPAPQPAAPTPTAGAAAQALPASHDRGAIAISCPNCGAPMSALPVGRMAQCPYCSQVFEL